jgi:sugar lactone lactonase YvrE
MGLGHSSARPDYIPPVGAIEASNYSLYLPVGLAFDAAGDLFIADSGDNVILEVNVDGMVSAVAGTGAQGFGGDGGAATGALLDSPTGVAVDAAGNIYIADTHNNRIRKVSGGVITTIAGTGAANFSGDGAAAAAATLSSPTAIAVDSNNNIYIADTNNHRIREISGTTINTVAGNGSQNYSGDGSLATAAGLDSPSGAAVDAAFNIYIGDTHNQRVRMVTFATGKISTIAGTSVKGFNGDGLATTAELALPSGVAVGANGIVYVADSGNHRIRAISGGQITTIAGNGGEGYTGDSGASTNAQLDTPRAVSVQGSTVVFSDTLNHVVREVSGGGLNTIVGSPTNTGESLALSGATSNVYGTGTLTATFAKGSNIATGQVSLYDGLGASPTLVGTKPLSANTATFNTSLLSAGIHYLAATYAGDGNNPATTSGVFVLAVTPVQLTAVANPVALLYGQGIPALTGTLNGVLAQDTGKVTANFSTMATITSAPAIYPITVNLSGTAAINYTVVTGPLSGSVHIAQAPSGASLSTSSPTPILGASVTMTATISSTTSGTPTGTVNFYDGAMLLNATPVALSGGVAQLVLTTLPLGSQSLTAVYSGDTNFLTSTSTAVPENVITPDFNITSPTPAQTVLPNGSVNYTITLTPMNPAFVYPVTYSVTSTLPTGVTASFNPTSINAGAGVSSTMLTLTTNAQARLDEHIHSIGGAAAPMALALLMLPVAFSRRAHKIARQLSRSGKAFLALMMLAGLCALAGCGGGGFFSHPTEYSTVTVTAVCGPNTHATNVTLIIK